jgi:spore coat polysaccharide biosynthesis protein SpsF
MKNNQKTIACIIARMRSSRFPGKVMKPIHNKPAIQYLTEKIQRCVHVDDVVVCTTNDPSDEPLVEFLASQKIPFYRGESEDVISRLIGVAKFYEAENIIRITADNLFTDPTLTDMLIEHYLKHDVDYARIIKLPLGATPEIMRTSLLTHIQSSVDPKQSEYLLIYTFDPKNQRCLVLTPPEELQGPYYSLTMDTFEDYQRLLKISESLNNPDTTTLLDVIKYMSKSKELHSFPPEKMIKMPYNKHMTYADFLEWIDVQSSKSLQLPLSP